MKLYKILLSSALFAISTLAFSSVSVVENNIDTTQLENSSNSSSYFIPITLENTSPDGNQTIIPVKSINLVGSLDMISTDHQAVQTIYGLGYVVNPGEKINFTVTIKKDATVECRFNLMDDKYCDVNIFNNKLPKKGALVAMKLRNEITSYYFKNTYGVFVLGVSAGGQVKSGLYEYSDSWKVFTLTEKNLDEPSWYSDTYDTISLVHAGIGANESPMKHSHFNLKYKQ